MRITLSIYYFYFCFEYDDVLFLNDADTKWLRDNKKEVSYHDINGL